MRFKEPRRLAYLRHSRLGRQRYDEVIPLGNHRCTVGHVGERASCQGTLPPVLCGNFVWLINMKKRVLYSLLFTALGVNLFFGAQVYLRSAEASESNNVYKNLRLFSLVLERVREDYVDGSKLTYQDLVYRALKGLLGSLDPHSELMDPQQYGALKKDTEGSFGGLGIQVGLRNNYLTVIAPIEGTPASRAGIFAGDRIIRIEGIPCDHMGLSDAVKRLRGAVGTKVTLTIMRPSNGMVKDFTLKREVIQVDTVLDLSGQTNFPLDANKIGYVRITQFGEKTGSELAAALKKLHHEGMQGLILDLRDNPGGLLDQAAKVCGLFVPHGTLVVSTEGRDPADDRRYYSEGHTHYLKVPMVVLVNSWSASAAEIVSGCLQDLKRAVILGEQTFGKGSVQSILQLDNGWAMRLTTAKYYTPSHRVIHEKGITPDIIVHMSSRDAEALTIKRTPGLLQTLSPERQKAIRAVHDIQLERAKDVLKGIRLFASLHLHAPEATPVERTAKLIHH